MKRTPFTSTLAAYLSLGAAVLSMSAVGCAGGDDSDDASDNAAALSDVAPTLVQEEFAAATAADFTPMKEMTVNYWTRVAAVELAYLGEWSSTPGDWQYAYDVNVMHWRVNAQKSYYYVTATLKANREITEMYVFTTSGDGAPAATALRTGPNQIVWDNFPIGARVRNRAAYTAAAPIS